MPTPSSSLQTRISRGLVIFSSGASRPAAVVMSGTETTNSMPLSLSCLMMFAPERPSTCTPQLAFHVPRRLAGEC